MRPLVVLSLVALAACAPRDAEQSTLSPTSDVATSTSFEGRGMQIMEVQSVSGGRAVVAHEVPLEADAVWNAMDAAFTEIGFRGAGVVDAGRRVFGFPNAVIPRRLGGDRLSAYLDCGRNPAGENADSYRVTGSVLTAVRPSAEGKSIVEATVEASARPRDVSGNTMRCSSNGRLEKLIAHTAALRAAATR